jgi:hypothetical protein
MMLFAPVRIHMSPSLTAQLCTDVTTILEASSSRSRTRPTSYPTPPDLSAASTFKRAHTSSSCVFPSFFL